MKTKLKKIMFGLGLAVLGNFAVHSQGLQGIIVEKYYQTTAADATWALNNGATTTLTPGSVVYRVYVDMAPGYKYNLAFGNSNHPWKITTTTNFYNDPNNGQAIGPQGNSVNNTRQGTTLIDSWLTTGGVASGKAGVLKIEDTDGALGNSSGILNNTLGGIYGAPINSVVSSSAVDGLLPSSALTLVAPTVLGVGSAADVFDQTPGNQFLVNGGSVAALGGVVGTTSTNAVLIGQFTTDGVLGFELNIQIQNTVTGTPETYVANNPQSGEIFFAGLTLAPPTVSITSPANNANYVTGSLVNITASATSVGTVTSVEFRVDGISVGTDFTAPYAATYSSTAGTHTITAIATDNNSLTATSSAVLINVANNQAPNVSVVAPSGAITGQVVTFTANAVDPDGTVASVTFSVDNVALGTTTVGGPVYTYTWLATFGAHSVRASALDNLGANGISTPVGFNVVNNVPPAVAIVSPLNNALVTGTTGIITISATASDVDGVITSVEFFANNISLGSVSTSPYTFTWQPTAFGANILKVVATDNAAGTTTSSPITVNIANPNALPYEIGAVSQKCNQGTFCLPISSASTYTVDNVIGYDIVLNYDAARVTPTGSITVNPTLINPNFVTVVNAYSNGTMNISAYLNGTAPSNAEFNGTGEIFCVGFVKNSMTEVDTAIYSISSLDESYFIGVSPRLVSNGRYTTYRDTMLPGRLVYANTGIPVRYNSGNPNDYLITNIYGADASCVTNTVGPVQPDMNGDFVYNVLKGSSINIDKDILPLTSVQLAINGNDVFIGRNVLLNSTTLTPSVYQMVALDVNLDGIVSSGDISQINQRSVLSISEFKQSWNYDAAGTNTLGLPSKDYTFIDSVRIQTDPAYAISATYPLNDNAGYSKFRVPSTPFCLAVRQSSIGSCPTLTFEVYKGVMLGDADLNVSSLSGTLQNRPSGDKVIIDLSKAIVNGNTVEVPVSFESANPVVALDFALYFDEKNLTYNQMVNYSSSTDALAYLNPNDKTLRFTATKVDLSDFANGQAVASIRFETSNGVIDADQLTGVVGLLNGKAVGVEVLSKAVGIDKYPSDNAVSIHPNPTSGILHVTSISDATIQMFDVAGKEVLNQSSVKASKTQTVDVSELANGVYFMKISNNDFVTIKKVVLNK